MEDRRGQQQGAGEGAQRGTPWGFFLVLAAIVVVAVMYSVTIFFLEPADRTPETVFGALAASFTVIGTLVGTYFGIKAGLDGQDKLKEGVGRAAGTRESRDRERDRERGREGEREREHGEPDAKSNGGQRGERRPAEDEAGGPRVRRRGDREDWEGVGV